MAGYEWMVIGYVDGEETFRAPCPRGLVYAENFAKHVVSKEGEDEDRADILNLNGGVWRRFSTFRREGQ